jgi:predicted transcriptional regulator
MFITLHTLRDSFVLSVSVSLGRLGVEGTPEEYSAQGYHRQANYLSAALNIQHQKLQSNAADYRFDFYIFASMISISFACLSRRMPSSFKL